MIHTVTFNPSLDYYVKVNNIKAGVVNRTSAERMIVGGKGVNVSLELKELGDETLALGFVAGFTGKAICANMDELGLNHDFINVEGQSRINVKIKSNTETDINGIGANVAQEDVDKLVRKIKRKIKPDDWLVVSGSAPATLGSSAYDGLLKKFTRVKGINLVVDASGELLTKTLKYKPFLIKPNIFELCEIFDMPLTSDTKIIASYARKLQELGARNVLVSLGSQGALMVTETDQAMFVRAALGQLVNSVGAGDSMVAGFIHEYIKTGSYFKALNFATAAGSACAFTDNLPTREQIEYVESLML